MRCADGKLLWSLGLKWSEALLVCLLESQELTPSTDAVSDSLFLPPPRRPPGCRGGLLPGQEKTRSGDQNTRDQGKVVMKGSSPGPIFNDAGRIVWDLGHRRESQGNSPDGSISMPPEQLVLGLKTSGLCFRRKLCAIQSEGLGEKEIPYHICRTSWHKTLLTVCLPESEFVLSRMRSGEGSKTK